MYKSELWHKRKFCHYCNITQQLGDSFFMKPNNGTNVEVESDWLVENGTTQVVAHTIWGSAQPFTAVEV